MATRHTREEPTGIYRAEHTEYTGDDAVAALHDIAARDAHQRDHWCDDTKAYAESLQADCDALKDERIRKAVAKQLATVVTLCGTVRRYESDGDVKSALRFAYEIGRLIESCIVRINAERDAGRGKRTLAAARLGHEAVHGDAAAKQRERDHTMRLWDEAAREHPEWGVSAVDSFVAEKIGRSPATVARTRKRHTK